MDEIFASGRIVDAIVALVFVEAAALLAWRAARGSGPAPLALLGNLVAGLFCCWPCAGRCMAPRPPGSGCV